MLIYHLSIVNGVINQQTSLGKWRNLASGNYGKIHHAIHLFFFHYLSKNKCRFVEVFNHVQPLVWICAACYYPWFLVIPMGDGHVAQ